MSTLSQFLVQNPVENLTAQVVVSNRLAEFPFTVKAMTNPEFSEYQKLSTTANRHGKVDFNARRFNELVVINQTLEPNFKDAELLKQAGCTTPEQFLNKSLLAGEVAELAQQISILSGFDRDMGEVVEEAKNS